MKTKVTKQRFNTIKAQLRNPGNDPERIAQAHGLKTSTVKVIRQCKDFAAYSKRRGSKPVVFAKAQPASVLDSNLTKGQAKAWLEMQTLVETYKVENRTLKRTLNARNTLIAKKDEYILELKAQVQNASGAHTIIEKARAERDEKRGFLSLLRRGK